MLQHIPFIIRNSLRNRRRSILTIASIGISLCLLGVLLVMYHSLFDTGASPAQALRLVVHHKVSLAQALPSSYKGRIREIDGVRAISTWQWFGGTYKDSRDTSNFFARLGVDPREFFDVRSDIILPPDQKTAFLNTQSGAIANKDLADKLHWKIGDKIDLIGDIFPVNLDLTLVGIYTDPDRDEALFYNDKYLQESLSADGGQKDTDGAFLVLTDAPENVPRLCKAIDAAFANSPAPTKTESEKDFALSFLAFLGNIKMFLAAICGAVTFTILLVSANTVAMTVRERIREVAILRTLGFTPGEIRGLILGEAGFLSLLGGVVGATLAASLCFAMHNSSFRMPLLRPETAGILLVVAVVIGMASAAIPAVFASHRPVVESLRYSG